MTIILGIISAGFVILAIIFVLIRLLFDLRFAAIQKEPDQSPLFRRKVNYLRKLEQARHIRYLLLVCLMTGLGLMLFIGSFLFLAEDHQKLKSKNAQLEDRIKGMEYQQEQLILSIPLKNYPDEGIGLKAHEWNKLTAETKDSKLQSQMEATISQQTMPYFGSIETSVSLSEPKTMSLQLKGRADDEASKETIQKNIDRFAKEAEGISELTNIHVRMITSVGKEKKVVYSVNYSRENSEGVFNKKNVSEQNLKNDGGKG
ncbi:hypothetical protein [Candidatus Enterococcus murrayae]|uniref:Uncharacterized protein n=1 Tax=Candidatus Enterococcus murrayae TaxID=2815321 RepID=A0ABS3HLC4_9ENTE|nr:hypothetical protein [Enterococcus sp. MJM16]MBO0454243.1 hypothetical protein [Enterococcus sp. MJM16]